MLSGTQKTSGRTHEGSLAKGDMKNMISKSIQMSFCTLLYKIEVLVFQFQFDSGIVLSQTQLNFD